MADVAVAGAGVVGIVTALLLARRGHHVVLLDQDLNPPDGTPDDDFAGWQRPGVPQAQHGHVFRARLTRVLREEAPDVLASLLARGIVHGSHHFGEGYEDDMALSARRPVFEAALRRIIANEPGVELRTGVSVAGLLADEEVYPPEVTGVRLDDKTVVHADLVVDCCGRRSAAPRWLRQIGSELAFNYYQPCQLHYFARHYRLRPGTSFPDHGLATADLTPYGLFLALAEDNGTFCLSGGLSKNDPYRPAFRDGESFDRVMSQLPRIAPWLEAGTPISDVQLMGGLANRRRSLVRDGEPVVTGYVLVGDASLYTNATLGQGIALGFWQAQALAGLSDLIGRDNKDLVRSLEGWTDRTLGPRYTLQVGIDEAMVESLQVGIDGGPLLSANNEMAALDALRQQGDPEAEAAYHRVDNLLSELDEVLAHQPLRGRVDTFLAHARPGFSLGPLPRDDFEALFR